MKNTSMFSTMGMSREMLDDIGLGSVPVDTDIVQVNTDVPDVGSSFSMGNLQGIGTLASVIGGLMASRDDNKFKKKVYQEETARAKREEVRAEKFRSDFAKGWQ